MKNFVLRNSYHGTSVVVRSSASSAEEAWYQIMADVHSRPHPSSAAKRRLRRIEQTLCGIEGCQCGIVR